jgi:hypothetical protein
MLRGDGSLTKTTKSGNSQLQIWQKSKEFVEHLWILLSTIGIVGALPYTLERFDSRTGLTYTATRFATFGLPFFGALFHEWYTIVNGKATKRLPANIANLLTPVALAYWTASDGTYHKKTGAVILCTDSFSPEEVDLLRSILLI